MCFLYVWGIKYANCRVDTQHLYYCTLLQTTLVLIFEICHRVCSCDLMATMYLWWSQVIRGGLRLQQFLNTCKSQYMFNVDMRGHWKMITPSKRKKGGKTSEAMLIGNISRTFTPPPQLIFRLGLNYDLRLLPWLA